MHAALTTCGIVLLILAFCWLCDLAGLMLGTWRTREREVVDGPPPPLSWMTMPEATGDRMADAWAMYDWRLSVGGDDPTQELRAAVAFEALGAGEKREILVAQAQTLAAFALPPPAIGSGFYRHFSANRNFAHELDQPEFVSDD